MRVIGWRMKRGVGKAGWKTVLRERMERYLAGQAVQKPVAAREVVCAVCSRKFRRERDKKRHKCLGERKKAVNEQEVAAQCHACNKWFKSRGGLANHNYRPPGINTHRQDLRDLSGA